MLRTICLILCLAAGSRQLSITEFVVPSSVEVGQNAELRCRYDVSPKEAERYFMKWWWKPTANEMFLLYQKIAGRPAVRFQRILDLEIKDDNTIVLLRLQPNATGTYECVVSTLFDELIKNQELIVYSRGSGPRLDISLEADGPDEDGDKDARIKCEATGVTPTPRLVVSVNGTEINMTDILDGPDGQGFYTVTSYSTLNKSDVDGAEVRCELLFVNPNVVHAEFVTTEVFKPISKASEVP